jgi:hypothetical protein
MSALLKRSTGERAGQRHLQPVEDPGDAERGHDQAVEAAPGQPVEPRRDVALNDLAHGHWMPSPAPCRQINALNRAVFGKLQWTLSPKYNIAEPIRRAD